MDFLLLLWKLRVSCVDVTMTRFLMKSDVMVLLILVCRYGHERDRDRRTDTQADR